MVRMSECESQSLPDGKVLVKNSSGARRKRHTDPDCRYVTEDHDEWDEELAIAWGYEECLECQGIRPTGGYSSN